MFGNGRYTMDEQWARGWWMVALGIVIIATWSTVGALIVELANRLVTFAYTLGGL